MEMKYFLISILTFCFLIESDRVYGSVITVKEGEKHSISLNLPSPWKYHQKVFGMDHVLLGPFQKKKPRSSVSFTFTGLEKLSLEEKRMRETISDYKKGRREWAKREKITIKSFLPYELLKEKKEKRVHFVGFIYEKDKKEILEQSYYIECGHSFIFSKSYSLNEKKVKNTIQEIIKSIEC